MPVNHEEVPVEQLRRHCDPSIFPFETTDEIEPLKGTVGQDRGVSAVRFGIDVKTSGFNLYIAGPTGTGRNSTVHAFVTEQAKREPVPDDLCYVNNFKDPDSPKAIILPAGMGCGLVKDMDELVESARGEIPRAFDGENYEKRRNDIVNTTQQERSKLFNDLQQAAQGLGLAIEMTQVGIVTVPVLNNKPLSREDFERLPQEQKDDIERKSAQLQEVVQQVLAKARKMEKETNEKIDQLDREVAL
ncbi:MAG: AAA family ATPase, partial [Armatimonadetes bacterium]|nr:AAA family ATPase [Armatimonadota bacterium]